MAGNRADVGASMARSEGGSERKGLKDGARGSERERVSALTSGDHRTERTSACARREPAPTGRSHRAARGGARGERARARWADRRVPHVSEGRCAGAGARGAGTTGLAGPKWLLLFPGIF
jgi:hypothetical protein